MKKRNNLLSTVFPPCLQFVCISSLFVILISILAGRFFGTMQTDIGKIVFWNIEYFFVMALCMELFGWIKDIDRKRMMVISALYAVSFLLIWISSDYQVLNFWMTGVLLTVLVIPTEMAIALQIIAVISFCMLNELPVEAFICYFTFGTLIILLAQFLDKLKNTLAIVMIAVTTNLAFLILLQNFALVFSLEVIFKLISTAVMIVFLWGVQTSFRPSKKQKTVRVKENLMEQLKEFSESIYEHSLLVGEISKGAAAKIHAKEDVAYAGGCYHEIGRIRGNEYIANGVEILEEHGISKDVIKVVTEHNINQGKPTSKEAAIVMLCDSIASTIQYLRLKKPETEVTMERIVQSIFMKRFEKGLFDGTGLSLGELNQLKEYFKEAFEKKEDFPS